MALSSTGLQTHIWNNNIKSILLLTAYPFLLLALVWLFFAGMAVFGSYSATPGYHPYGTIPDPVQAGFIGMWQYWPVAFGAAGIWFVISFLFHQSMINAATGARPVERSQAPQIYNMLENLCISRGMTMPKLHIIETDALNAYASGISEKSYSITLTRALVERLNAEELEAVIGHELSHIRNRDVRLLIVSIIFVGMISFLCEMLFRSLVYGRRSRSSGRSNGLGLLIGAAVLAIGYVFSLLIRFAISRRREYMADAGSVELTKNPAALANALRKISGHDKIPGAPDDVKQLFIENSTSLMGLFASHPPIEKRIAILEQLAGSNAVSSAAIGPWG